MPLMLTSRVQRKSDSETHSKAKRGLRRAVRKAALQEAHCTATNLVTFLARFELMTRHIIGLRNLRRVASTVTLLS